MSSPENASNLPADRRIYWKSLLQINIPLAVTLAEKQIPTDQIIKLVPGAIIHFDKACDMPLNLEIDGKIIATGDAVKVGDKFGLKLLNIEQRQEKFLDVGTHLSAKKDHKNAPASGQASGSASSATL